MAEHKARGWSAIIAALSNRGFLYYSLGGLASQIGNWVYRVASGWLMWELTESATWLGLLGFALQAPSVFSPLAGALADRLDRLTLARITQFLLFLQGLILAALTLTDRVDAVSLTLLAFAQGVIQSVDQPARYSLYPSLIGPDELTAAVATDSITFNTARLIGPATAGYVIVNYGAGFGFVINAVTFAVFFLLLCVVRAPKAPLPPKRGRNLTGEVRDGVRYAVRHKGIGPILSLLAISTMLAMPIQHLLPGFASEIFHQGVVGLSWMTAVMGLGAMTGSLWLARRGHFFGLTSVMVRALLFAGGALLLFTATDIFYVALIACYFTGGSHTLSRGSCQTLIQNAVEGEMRGRVMSLFGLIFRAAPALGALIMGAAAEVFGLRPPLAVAGALLAVAWWWSSSRYAGMAEVLEIDPRERTR